MRYFPFFIAIACSSASNSQDRRHSRFRAGSEDTSPMDVAEMGVGYLLDGETNNSLFTLELTNATSPPEGDSYSAFLLGGSSEIESLVRFQ